MLPLILTVFSLSCLVPPDTLAADTTVIAEGHYLMGDGDTLAMAEERVLQQAKRRAVEEAGVYLESTFHDVERSVQGRSFQTSSLEIRTVAAAVTKTEILEARRAIEHDRPSFFVRIRAVVNLDNLREAVHRWKSEQQFAAHFRQLQKENTELKAQLRDLQTRPPGVRMLAIAPAAQNSIQARSLLDQALESHDLRQKLDLTSQAVALDPDSPDPLIVRGQTYLRLVSLAYSNRSQPREYSRYVDEARMDFDRALLADPKNTWALLGQGDVHTWLNRPEAAAAAYEQALRLDPFFDVARQRLIALHTTSARKLMATKHWSAALGALNNVLEQSNAESWIPYLKEALLLRSEIYQRLNQRTEAIQDLTTVLQADPTNASALLARGKLYQEQLQGRPAKEDFEHACLLGATEACEQLP
jgi:tetratricopeptide (TPR) repeat protein